MLVGGKLILGRCPRPHFVSEAEFHVRPPTQPAVVVRQGFPSTFRRQFSQSHDTHCQVVVHQCPRYGCIRRFGVRLPLIQPGDQRGCVQEGHAPRVSLSNSIPEIGPSQVPAPLRTNASASAGVIRRFTGRRVTEPSGCFSTCTSGLRGRKRPSGQRWIELRGEARWRSPSPIIRAAPLPLGASSESPKTRLRGMGTRGSCPSAAAFPTARPLGRPMSVGRLRAGMSAVPGRACCPA